MVHWFVGSELLEDTWLDQIRNKYPNSRLRFMGDDTWLALFPSNRFHDVHPYPSLDVFDLDTVDHGCIRHLFPAVDELHTSSTPQIIIAHFLGGMLLLKRYLLK